MNILRSIHRPTGEQVVKTVFALATALISVSCAKNELQGTEGGSDAPKEINFNIIPVKTGTKAATFSQFPETASFGTRAYFLPGAKNWKDNSKDAVTYISDESISFNSGAWKAWKSGKSYWWPQTGRLTFFCWAPENLTSKGLGINTTDGICISSWKMENTAGFGGETEFDGSTPADGSTDILIASSYDLQSGTINSWPTSDGSSFTGNGAKIQFSHALCKVQFFISLGPDEDESTTWYIEKAEIKDICTSGDYVGNSWTNQGDRATYSYDLTTAEKPEGQKIAKKDTLLFPMTMVMPQRLTRPDSYVPRIDLVAWDGKSYVYEDGVKVKEKNHLTGYLYSNTAEAAEWKAGTRIVYHLYLTKDSGSYIEFNASVSQWTGTDGGEIEIK